MEVANKLVAFFNGINYYLHYIALIMMVIGGLVYLYGKSNNKE